VEGAVNLIPQPLLQVVGEGELAFQGPVKRMGLLGVAAVVVCVERPR
jgi:hypothetical protein